jgi:hypothetical protein
MTISFGARFGARSGSENPARAKQRRARDGTVSAADAGPMMEDSWIWLEQQSGLLDVTGNWRGYRRHTMVLASSGGRV